MAGSGGFAAREEGFVDLKACLSEGDIEGAISAANHAVKSAPTDANARLALFETLCFAGHLMRAKKQLDVLADESMERAYGATALLAMIEAEEMRREVMAGKMRPDFLGEDHAWADPVLRALVEPADPETLEKQRAPVKGKIGDQTFSDLRDGDDLLAPVLEFSVAGRYVWLAWNQVKTLTSNEPKSLLDLCWMPVRLELHTGDACEGVVPVLYYDSYKSDDGALKLGHATDWVERDGLVRGVGRRMLYADGNEVDLLGVRSMELG